MSEVEDRMRVVIVVSQLGFGGAERQTLDLLGQLRGTPWAPVGVICLSSNVGRHGDAVRALGYSLAVVPRVSGFDVGRIVALRRQLRQQAVDVIHAVNWFASGYAVLAKPRGARVISSIRNSHLPAGALRRMALTRLVRRSDGVLVNSERGRQLVMDACRVPAARIALAPNGIDVDRLQSAVPGAVRRELGIPAAAPVVSMSGRNARVKNIPRLLGVVPRCCSRAQMSGSCWPATGSAPTWWRAHRWPRKGVCSVWVRGATCRRCSAMPPCSS